MTDRWAILRCSGASTLRLAESLRDAGFETWTPAEEVRKAVRGKFAFVSVPMLPSFVFTKADRLSDLISLARSPALMYQVWDSDLSRMVTKGHPFFRLFHGDGGSVPDHELEPLRRIEGRRKRKPRGKPRVWQAGDRVRLTQGAYEGLRGHITAVKGGKVEVTFPGSSFSFWLPAYVPIPDLDEPPVNALEKPQPEVRFRAAA